MYNRFASANDNLHFQPLRMEIPWLPLYGFHRHFLHSYSPADDLFHIHPCPSDPIIKFMCDSPEDESEFLQSSVSPLVSGFVCFLWHAWAAIKWILIIFGAYIYVPPKLNLSDPNFFNTDPQFLQYLAQLVLSWMNVQHFSKFYFNQGIFQLTCSYFREPNRFSLGLGLIRLTAK